MTKKKYTFIDLFAGCGGLSLGLEQAGFEVVFMNEIVNTFASTYLANHNLKEGQYFIGDINELNKCLGKYSDILKIQTNQLLWYVEALLVKVSLWLIDRGLLMIPEINFIRPIYNSFLRLGRNSSLWRM